MTRRQFASRAAVIERESWFRVESLGLEYRIAFRPLSRHPSQYNSFLRRYPKIPRRLERTPDIRIFRAAIESNQLHAMRALHLIAVPESRRSLAERLATFRTKDLYPIGHEILRAVGTGLV
jgi:hypothetical protein